MLDGYIKVKSITTNTKTGDINYNKSLILDALNNTSNDTKIAVFPMLTLTGLSLNDLFTQESILQDSINALIDIKNAKTYNLDMLVFIGLPLRVNNNIINAYAVLLNNEIIAFNQIVNSNIWNGFANKTVKCQIMVDGKNIPVGNFVYDCLNVNNLTISFKSDNISKSSIVIDPKCDYDFEFTNHVAIEDNMALSRINNNAIITCCNSVNESSADGVYGGINSIIECGEVISYGKRFKDDIVESEIDLQVINSQFEDNENVIKFDYKNIIKTSLTRGYNTNPFAPYPARVGDYYNNIIKLISLGIKKRLEYIGINKVVLGLSGGLDSTCALILLDYAFKLLDIDSKNIICISMPGFGTSTRTYNNSELLAKAFNTSFKIIDIKDMAKAELEAINHDEEDVVFENVQARIRTELLMNIAGKEKAINIGTSDLSEIALGFSTYNADQMSHYCVNAGLPKSLIRELVGYYANNMANKLLKEILLDIVDTPISPELLKGTQNTEDIIGPYELNDFILYHVLKHGFTKEKINRIMNQTFNDRYDNKFIENTINNFYKRFISQQFKRSCMPDGINAIGLSMSPRCGYYFPSDTYNNFTK